MRIITVTTFFPNAVSPQRTVFVKNLVQALKRHCNVEVIAPVPYAPALPIKREWVAKRGIPARDTIDGIDVEHPRFVILPKLDWFSGVGYFFGILRALRGFANEKEQVIIHVHCAYPDAVGVALAARMLRLPYVVTAHGSDINVYARRLMLRWQIRWALSRAAGVIAVSRPLEIKIRELLGPAARRIANIPCAAFDPRIFSLRPQQEARTALGVKTQGRLVVFVGLLVPIKGVEFLIDAWKEMHRRESLHASDCLVLLGDGPSRPSLALRVADAEIANIIQFQGSVEQKEVAQWMAAADLLCLPSQNEGTPNVVLEAFACGVPVVASRVGGLPDLIQEGENGFLVPPADSGALANAIERALIQSWDREAIARSVAHRTWQAISHENFKFFQSLLNDHDAVA